MSRYLPAKRSDGHALGRQRFVHTPRTIRDRRSLLDRRGADLAGDFILRAGAAGTADRADQLAAFDQRNAASRGDDSIEGDEVIEAVLDSVLESLGFAPEGRGRSEEHTSELQSQSNLVCRLLLEKKKPYSDTKTPDYVRSYSFSDLDAL